MGAGQRVDRQDGDGEDDHGGEHADDLHDAVEVQEGREDHEHRTQGAAGPRGHPELLLEVRARAGEHHEAHGESGEDENHVDDASQRRVSDPLEDLVVVVGAVVGAELQGDAPEKHVQQAEASCLP